MTRSGTTRSTDCAYTSRLSTRRGLRLARSTRYPQSISCSATSASASFQCRAPGPSCPIALITNRSSETSVARIMRRAASVMAMEYPETTGWNAAVPVDLRLLGDGPGHTHVGDGGEHGAEQRAASLERFDERARAGLVHTGQLEV